jgi:hypothetical protein
MGSELQKIGKRRTKVLAAFIIVINPFKLISNSKGLWNYYD